MGVYPCIQSHGTICDGLIVLLNGRGGITRKEYKGKGKRFVLGEKGKGTQFLNSKRGGEIRTVI